MRKKLEGVDIAARLEDMDGKVLNAAEIARRLGVSRRTAVDRIAGVARLVPYLGGGHKPLLYLRTGRTDFKGLCVNILMDRIDAGFFWWKAQRRRKIDLIAKIGSTRIGFCFCDSDHPKTRDWSPLAYGAWQKAIDFGYFLDRGSRRYTRGGAVKAMPLEWFLTDLANSVVGALWLVESGIKAFPAGLRFNKERKCCTHA
ncbi:MAG TPA: hypothetical protein VMM82_13065 [Spirochaetia bacterium]|nr:hypothetical protein [Spirochaetia bacterium]